jgi:hypothetical protein
MLLDTGYAVRHKGVAPMLGGWVRSCSAPSAGRLELRLTAQVVETVVRWV